MSIKDPGRAEIYTERRTSKINCWEKMQTKCFCSGERDRIRADCSHTDRPWICLKCCNFTDIVAKSWLQFACPQKPKVSRSSAGCFSCSRNKRRALLPRSLWSEFGPSELCDWAPSLSERTAATGDNYKWAFKSDNEGWRCFQSALKLLISMIDDWLAQPILCKVL